MNMNKNTMFVMLGLLGMSNFVAADANDNEIWIAQTGNNVELTLRQIGAGNKYGGDDFTGTSIDMTMTVSDTYLDLLLDGDYNKMFGTVSTTGSTINNFITGNYNKWNQKIGVANTADTMTMDTVITGNTNSIVLRAGNDDDTYNLSTPLWGQTSPEKFWQVSGSTWSRVATGQQNFWATWNPTAGSADSLDFDLDVTGSDNTMNVFVNSTNAKFNWDVIGSDNWIQTTMEDGADNDQTVGVTGSYNYIFVGQDTGSTVGVTNNAIFNATFATTHSDINIIQSDAN